MGGLACPQAEAESYHAERRRQRRRHLSLAGLARNLDDLSRLVQKLTKCGVRIQFVKENLTFTG